MGLRSRRKGQRGERELASWLTANGYPATRGQQFKGGSESPDVQCGSLPVFVECKRAEKLALYDALKQAQADSNGQPVVVFHRRNGQRWVAILDGLDFLNLMHRHD
jgi:Holliday junction resolvase